MRVESPGFEPRKSFVTRSQQIHFLNQSLPACQAIPMHTSDFHKRPRPLRGTKPQPQLSNRVRGNRESVLHENRTICIGERQSRTSINQESGPEEEDVEIKPCKSRVFCDNRVVSYKYTLWSFIPRNLFEQFRRIANFYFLCITIIQLTIDSPVSATTSILPLAFVISVTAVKQGYEDWLRHRADAKVNRTPTTILDSLGNKKIVECSHLMVGDIVRVEDGEDLPCDMVLLASSRKDGRGHVTTANLDGETNLKTLQCPRPLRFLSSSDLEPQLAQLQLKIVCEEPTADLYNFSGTLEVLNEQKIMKNGPGTASLSFKEERRSSHKSSMKSKIKFEPKVSLSIDNLLLRGARLKNTDFIYGCAVYTGQETKLSLNSKLTRNKFSSVEKAINGFLFFFLVIIVIEVLVSIALKLVQEKSFTSVNAVFNEPKRKITPGSVVQDVFSFIILYNYLIPISLYVTIELQKFLGTFFFMWDKDMYCEKTKQAAVCNTSDLNEELGQVQYLFTDKTGTLTENLMEFQRCSINGVVLQETDGKLIKLMADGREENGIEVTDITPEIEEFFIALALCHTAQVEKLKQPSPQETSVQTGKRKIKDLDISLESLETVDEEDDEDLAERDPCKLVYQASSPDEKALLEAIRRCGVIYLGEKDDILYVKVKDRVRMFLRLDVLEFSSERSRMSIVVEEVFNDDSPVRAEKYPVIVYCKGAETVLQKLSVRGPKQETVSHIDDFAKRGLRTLMVGSRHLTKKEFATLSAAIQADRLHQAVTGPKKMSVTGPGVVLPPSDLVDKGHRRNFSAGADRKASLDSAIKTDLNKNKRQAMHHSRSKSSSDYRHFYGAKHDSVRDMGHRGHVRDRSASGSILRRLLSRQNSLLSSISNSDAIKCFPMIRRDSGLKDSDALLALESGLTVLGATAVRDQLQDKVAETLESLRAAGIKTFLQINVNYYLFLNSANIESNREKQYGMVVDGVSLHQIFYDGNGVNPKVAINLFLEVSCSCTAVVCCRMSPLQKCKVVSLVKNLNEKPITAAIGDGANDVSMIQEAHVGIGIMGKEGRQAARSSDFAFARFHFLRKALLVHGHWYYVRLATLTQYFFYKNIVFNTPQVCYGASSLFSTQALYDGLYLTFYNVLMTSLPITLFGLFEQNYSANILMKYPHLYLINRGNALMLWRKFFQWLFIGLWHALALYFAIWGIVLSNDSILSNGETSDISCFGTTIFHIVVVVVNLKLWLESKYWTAIFLFSIFISVVGNMILTYIYSIISPDFIMYGVYTELLTSANFWFVSIIITIACLVPDILIIKRKKNIHLEISHFWKKNSGNLTISNTRLAEQEGAG
ncbi:hypothetical protein J437_LFUL012866 [Ladona fulva]|uniref:Phospholipid-transporting ATPase n=1 Tax=Ladona fulva TaxID=123851 RepID=A0A8K0KE90_LADFU|nr:hypothetical protein J437_LFUL012866 [Ladona fulva]